MSTRTEQRLPGGLPAEPPTDELWEAVLAADEYTATSVVLRALDDGVPPEDVLLGMIAPVQRRVGQEWAANRINVAQEHAATAINERPSRPFRCTRPPVPLPRAAGSRWPASTASGTPCPPGCWQRS